MLQPVQAGNISLNAISDKYSKVLQAIPIDMVQELDDIQSMRDFRWGDYIYVSKLDESGVDNNLSAGCNLSSLLDTPIVQFHKKHDSKDLKSIESIYQIIPVDSSQFGKMISFGESKEVTIYLRNVLTGKFLYFDKEEDRLNLAEDYGKFHDYIKSKSSKIQSKYVKDLKEYNNVFKNEDIINKQEFITNTFSAT